MRFSIEVVIFAFLVFLTPVWGQAAPIDATVNNQSWLNAIWGAGPSTPTTGNDYAVSDPFTVRTSPFGMNAGGNADFTGNSLTVFAGSTGRLLVKQTTGQTASINLGSGNLTLDGGRLVFGPNGFAGQHSAVVLDVNLFEIASSGNTVELNNAHGTGTIDGTLTGTGDLLIFEQNASANRQLTISTISDYSGELTLDGTRVTLDFDSDYDFENSFTILNGILNVDQTFTFTFGDLIDPVNGAVAPGTYSGATLLGLGVNYADSGGTIIVQPVPEPTSIALWGIGLIGMAGFAYRRRRRNA